VASKNAEKNVRRYNRRDFVKAVAAQQFHRTTCCDQCPPAAEQWPTNTAENDTTRFGPVAPSKYEFTSHRQRLVWVRRTPRFRQFLMSSERSLIIPASLSMQFLLFLIALYILTTDQRNGGQLRTAPTCWRRAVRWRLPAQVAQ